MEKKKRNLDWVGKKRDFQYSGKPFYINFIPREKLESLSEEEYSKHSSYRRNYFEYYKSFDDIERKKREIKQIQEKQKTWKTKMMEGYSVIGYLGEDYDFNCSVNLREIKPKKNKGERKDYDSSVPFKDGKKMGRDTNNTWEGEHEIQYVKWKLKHDKVGEKKLFMDKLEDIRREKRNSVNPKKYYVRIEPKGRDKFKNNRYIRNLYVGLREDVLHLLKESNLFQNTDWNTISEKKLRDRLRELYKGYVRYQIYTNGLDCIKVGHTSKLEKDQNPHHQHPSDKVIDWFKEMGTGIVEWMDK